MFISQEQIAKGEVYVKKKFTGISPTASAALSVSSQNIVIIDGKFIRLLYSYFDINIFIVSLAWNFVELIG